MYKDCKRTCIAPLKYPTVLEDSSIKIDTRYLYAHMNTEAQTAPQTLRDCSRQDCAEGAAGIRDALYVLGGKWKLPLIFTLSGGPMRFNDIQRSIGDITAKILSRELKEMELNGFVLRSEGAVITYQLTPYSLSLHKVTHELKEWGMKHRQHIGASRKGKG